MAVSGNIAGVRPGMPRALQRLPGEISVINYLCKDINKDFLELIQHHRCAGYSLSLGRAGSSLAPLGTFSLTQLQSSDCVPQPALGQDSEKS